MRAAAGEHIAAQGESSPSQKMSQMICKTHSGFGGGILT